MQAAEWSLLAPLLDSLLDTPAEQRAARLLELSGGDKTRRLILEQLLNGCERNAPLLDRPAAERFDELLEDVDVQLPELLGDRYRVGREIGRGGMALVFLAHDEKHGRDVAIKVIRPEFAASLGRTLFLREMAIVARLRHPNIVPLYDSGDEHGVLYFVMPYEEGPSLRERMRTAQLPLPEAKRVLRDVARALAYAHSHGVMHRDVKPDNVMLSGGAAVVADFGIARAVNVAQAEVPTLGTAHTGAIGTPAYMAPEQSDGDPNTDHRADIYAFGCMAYEMLAGRLPLEAQSTEALQEAHRTVVPRPLHDVRPDVELRLARLIDQCLEKQCAARPQSAAALLANLERDTAAPETPRVRFRTVAGLVTVALATTAAAIALSLRRTDSIPVIGISIPLAVDDGLQVEAAISPDGRRVAYAKGVPNHLRVAVRTIGNDSLHWLTTDTTATQLLPQWAPDNHRLVYLSRNSAYLASVTDGTPIRVATGTDSSGTIRSASWSSTGDSIAIVRNDSLLVQPIDGTRARFVGVGVQIHGCRWSPNARWIACVSGNWVAFEPGPLFGNDAPSAIVLYPSAGGVPVDLTADAYQNESPAWSADGSTLWMLSSRGGAIGDVYAVRISPNGRAVGEFTRVGSSAESISLSSGRVAYSVQVQRANIWKIPVVGADHRTLVDAKPFTTGNQLIEVARASSDGKWIVYDGNQTGNADLYRKATFGETVSQLTDDAAPEYAGEISPDGKELAWHRFFGQERRLMVKSLDSTVVHGILPDSGDQENPRWSPDGRSIVAWSRRRTENVMFIVHRNAAGGWLAPKWQLGNADSPVWSKDGRRIAFIRQDGSIATIDRDSGAVLPVYTPRRTSADPIAKHIVWSLEPSTIWFIGSDQRGHGGIWLRSRNGRPATFAH